MKNARMTKILAATTAAGSLSLLVAPSARAAGDTAPAAALNGRSLAASRLGSNHSFQSLAFAKKWETGAATDAVRSLYRQVLERDVDPPGLTTWVRGLEQGRFSVKQVVRALGHSEEYKNRFVVPVSSLEAARLMYRHFLAREPEDDTVAKYWADVIAAKGWQAAVDGLVDSNEYRTRFGEDRVPTSLPMVLKP